MLQRRLLVIAGTVACLGLLGCSGTQTTSTQPAKQEQPKPAPTTGRAADGTLRGAMYFPTGDRGSSAVLLERVAPAEVRSGQEFDYVMRVTNLTSLTLKDVVVRDVCASNFSLVSSTPSAAGKSPEPLTWALGDLAPNGSKDITVRGKAESGTSITNCASVSYNSFLCVSSNVVDPELKVTMTGPAEASICDNVCYTYTVTNTGTGTARDVKVNFELPAGWTADKPGNTLAAGTLVAGQSREFKVCGKPNKTGAFTTTTSAASAGGLTAKGNAVNTTIKAPVLALAAECPGETLIGREMTFKFTLKNTGDMASAGTAISAPIPANTTFVRADNGGTQSGGKVEWNVGSLNAEGSRAVSMVVRNTGAGQITASAAATGSCAKAVQASCSTTVQGVPDIGTSISDETGVITIGNTHTFTYTVKNQGQVDLTNVTMVAEFDPGLDFVNSDWAGGAAAAENKVTWKIGTVRIGEQKQVRITAKGAKAGKLIIQTLTTSDQTPRGVRNDEQVNYIER